jgi:hypothetical protein
MLRIDCFVGSIFVYCFISLNWIRYKCASYFLLLIGVLKSISLPGFPNLLVTLVQFKTNWLCYGKLTKFTEVTTGNLLIYFTKIILADLLINFGIISISKNKSS